MGKNIENKESGKKETVKKVQKNKKVSNDKMSNQKLLNKKVDLNGTTKEKRSDKAFEHVTTVILCVVLLVIAAFGLWKLSGEDDKPEKKLVFTVGTEEVYLDEVHFCILQNVLNLGLSEAAMQETTAEDGSNAADYYKQEILELIMDYKVEYMIAKEQGLTLTEEEQKDVRNDVMTYLGKVDGRLLTQWGIKEEMIEEVYTQRYLAHKLEESVTEDVTVEDQKYCTIYLMLFPKIEMSEDGDFATEEDGETPVVLSEKEILQRKEDAEHALEDLKAGEDAAEVAKKYEVELYSGEESNLAESFEEPFSEYVQSLKENECSPVIETESYYGIVQMLKENNEEVAGQILEYYKADLKEEAIEEQKTEWYEQLGIGEEPVFEGNIWENISLYDYVQ